MLRCQRPTACIKRSRHGRLKIGGGGQPESGFIMYTAHIFLLPAGRPWAKSRFLGSARLIFLLLFCTSVFYGYSVLTHEAIVDSVWDTSIQKALLTRFPMATPAEIAEAHSYVYGGCILQDLGYYPFSSRFFSDLTHY